MKCLTIADPVELFDREAETTFFLLGEITRRKYSSWICRLSDLFLADGLPHVSARLIEVRKKGKIFGYRCGRRGIFALDKMDVVFLRKDPPVDLAYLTHLTMLEMAEKSGPLFINSPSGIKRANDKIYPLSFPGFAPPTLVSSSPDRLDGFLQKHGKVVVKPLNMSGGRGVFILHKNDADRKSLLELVVKNGSNYVLMQKFVAEAKKGDKRILLLNGKPLGAFVRIPQKKDFRGNLHSGASWRKAGLTARDQTIIAQLKPRLKADGLYFVGLDLLGNYVTEINTTSPMGIRELNQVMGQKFEKIFLDEIEENPLITKC